ncbi:MAG TPA: hypothetical protein VK708_08100 [Bryobacteraceae bacterium]|jgi:hypothetical protein|nr:hypothetical protein [Bryobacteraceae bacterium]
MNPRFLICPMLSAAAALFTFAPNSAYAQAIPAAAKVATNASPKAKTAHRTPDGQPDLQGVWSSASVTPLERPKDLGSKEFFTPEEAAAYEKKGLAAREIAAPGTYGDVHYNMAQFGLEKGQSRVASSIRTSLIVGPEGRIPPMIPEAVQRNAARAAANKGHEFDGPENRSLGEQCIMWPNEGPPMLPAGYNSNLQIVQGPGYVAVMQEMIHDVRIIPTDGSPHVASNIRQWFGDSRGHWEGDTLVVDTTNFTNRTAFRGSSENLHVVERFSRTDDDRLLYQFTVDDPSTWATSWSGELPMTKIDGPLFEYACHEGNYGMRNNLSGARAAEKAAPAGK